MYMPKHTMKERQKSEDDVYVLGRGSCALLTQRLGCHGNGCRNTLVEAWYQWTFRILGLRRL